MNETLTFDNVIQETLALFPEYIQTDHYKHNDPDLVFSFFFGFTSYVMETINTASEPESDPLIVQAFQLFNGMIESADSKLSNLGVVEVIETLVQEKKSKHIAQKLLRHAGQKYLQEVLKFTGVKD